jgi:hypothetical protein
VDVELPDDYILQGRVEFDEFAIADFDKCIRTIPTANRRNLRDLFILVHKSAYEEYTNNILMRDLPPYGTPLNVSYAGIPVHPHSEIAENAIEVYGPERHEKLLR